MLADDIPFAEQKNYLSPIESILMEQGCTLSYNGGEITVSTASESRHIIVYPAMRAEPSEDGTIFVSDLHLKYAKPYAVQKIASELHLG